MKNKLNKVSKYLSYILRHQPESIGLVLDKDGWVSIESLIFCARNSGEFLDKFLIDQVVVSSDKKRFSISQDGLRIRAAQGHSSKQVDIQYVEHIPPEFLFHGTATRFLASIREQGLIAGTRHYVHLSVDEKIAISVGQRYGTPIVFKVNALLMSQQGFKYYLADNGVWLTEKVAIEFLSIN